MKKRFSQFVLPGMELLEKRRLTAGDLSSSLPTDVTTQSEATAALVCLPYSSTTVGPSGEIVSQPLKIYEQADKTTQNLDVDQDGYITPDDAKLIIASLHNEPVFGPVAEGSASMQSSENGSSSTGTTARNLDVNDDGIVSPTDALAVMNRVHFYNALIPCTCAGCVAIKALES